MLTAIIAPAMLMPSGRVDFSFDNAYLLGGLATIVLAATTRHLLATIAGGMLAFFLLRWGLGQLGG